MATLIITADDYGYGRRYDEGILEAAVAGAVDAVSSFVLRPGIEPEPLLRSGVEVGLHLELAAPGDRLRADAGDRERAAADVDEQLRAFERLYGRPPAYLDGHLHSHAREGLGVVVCDRAAAAGLPVRSVDARHRRLLRCRGVATPDRFVGRLHEADPVLPRELAPDGAEALAAGEVVEWMVHPGRSDPAAGSGYDAGREEDLALLLSWEPPPGLRRADHATALRAPA